MKTPRQKAKEKADKWFSKYIRERDGACVICGTKENLQAGHLFSRVALSTRWDTLNCFAQCAGHNFSHEHDPYPFYNWFKKSFGEDAMDELYRKHKTTQKFSIKDIEEIAEHFKNKYEELR